MFEISEIGSGIRRIVNVLDNHAYLVEGTQRALLVDTAGGFGDLAACVHELTPLPITVVLTHGHYDHVAGSYGFDEAYIAPADGGMSCWETVEDHATRVLTQVVEEGVVPADVYFAPRDGVRPRELAVGEGDCFDLGGRVVRAIALPGHTPGSMGYLVEDVGVLLSGDAVTPIMCLFFKESLGLDTWRTTLAKMADIPFEHFYTGHHDYAFSKSDLASFDAAAAFVQQGDRGMEWQHARLAEFRGILHFCPSATLDADSPDFRAVIEPWHELPPRKRRRRA